MTVAEQLRFLFTTLHSGALNRALHLASLPVLAVGLARHRPALLVIGGLLEVIGHAYNYLWRFDPEQRQKAKQVLPVQLLATVVVVILLMGLFGWFASAPGGVVAYFEPP